MNANRTPYRSFRPPLLFAAATILLLPAEGHAALDDTGLAWASMSLGLFGGLALFLYGMQQMTDALKAAAGERMKGILARVTNNRFAGALTGATVTAVIQSSSVTTVLVVGFVSAGLMSLSQSIGVIMGANIGTTVTAQIVAFKVVKLALLFIAVGFAMLSIARRESVRYQGTILMGLGLVFYGMNVMSEAMAPLRSYQPFLDAMAGMEHPAIGILAGGMFTALIQSSSATTGIVIVMASQGFITLPAGIALALGANIGTCITAVFASIGKPRNAVRAASVHVIFNVLGVLIWVGFIDTLADLVRHISPSHQALSGIDLLGAEAPRQIANANTIFNLANTLLFIGLTGPMARVVTRLFPDVAPERERAIVRPAYLDDELIETPSLGLNMAKLEIGHLGGRIADMLQRTMPALQQGNRELIKEVEKMDDAVDILHADILRYLGRIGKQSLTEGENEEFYCLTHAADNLESIGDLIETDLVALGRKMIDENLHPSATMWRILAALHADVSAALAGAIKAVTETDQKAAQEVLAMKHHIHQRVDAARKRQTESLVGSEETRLATLRAEFEITEKMRHIYTLSKRIARLVVPIEV